MTWPTATAGWVLGERDDTRVLLATTDAGATWSAGTALDMTGAGQVEFADAENGWIVGATVSQLLSTHDGGSSWSAVTVPGGIAAGAAVAAANGTVHLAYIAGTGVTIASSPIDRDAFVPAGVTIPSGAGPRLEATMTAGGPYAELIYDDRTFVGAAEIRDGRWAPWDIACPAPNSFAAAALSPTGAALTIACGPSGFGGNTAVVGADLSTGTLRWTTIEPAGDPSQGQAIVTFAAALDGGARIVVFLTAAGVAVIATSTDGGATWRHRTSLPADAQAAAIAHLADGSVLLATVPDGGLVSADGITWTAVATSPS